MKNSIPLSSESGKKTLKNMHNDNLYKINEYLLLKITFLLKCFIVLFKPIYKNIYFTII